MFFQQKPMSHEQLLELLDIQANVLEVSQNAMFITDVAGYFAWGNSQFTKVTGYSVDELKGKNIKSYRSNFHSAPFYRDLWGTVLKKKKWTGEISNQRKDGTPFIEKVEVTPILNKQSEITHIVWVIHDITRKKAEEVRLKLELEMAKNIQRSVLSPPISNEKIEIDAAYFPSEMLAGDMYAWFEIDEDSYGVILVDVMGHGMPAALISMSIRSLLRGMVIRLKDPETIISEINKHMYRLFPEDQSIPKAHLSAFCLIIHTKTKTIEYVNAGHPPAFLYTNGQIEKLEKGTFVLGAFPDMPICKGRAAFEKGAKLVLYTDGLLEAISSSPITSKEFLKQYITEHYKLTNRKFIDLLIDDIRLLENHFKDDLCFISISF